MWELDRLIEMATMSPYKGMISFYAWGINFYGNSETTAEFFSNCVVPSLTYWATFIISRFPT